MVETETEGEKEERAERGREGGRRAPWREGLPGHASQRRSPPSLLREEEKSWRSTLLGEPRAPGAVGSVPAPRKPGRARSWPGGRGWTCQGCRSLAHPVPLSLAARGDARPWVPPPPSTARAGGRDPVLWALVPRLAELITAGDQLRGATAIIHIFPWLVKKKGKKCCFFG